MPLFKLQLGFSLGESIIERVVGSFEILDLGRMSYSDALKVQNEVLLEVQQGKRSHTLIFVEHDPVLTLGANFHTENLLFPTEWYEDKGIQIEKTDRGGDITYHGPGQLVAYPIFDVAQLGKDLHKWMRDLEETVIVALREFGIEGVRLDVNSGVWVNHRKICAIGIKIRRWVSMHGIAINCDANLQPFETIVPCGIRTHGVTSLTQELERQLTISDMKQPLAKGFQAVFELTLTERAST
jgi:lipoyl(octanoyl) transferase